MAYDGERPVVEIAVMLTEYEISVIHGWYNSDGGNRSTFSNELLFRILQHLPEQTGSDI